MRLPSVFALRASPDKQLDKRTTALPEEPTGRLEGLSKLKY